MQKIAATTINTYTIHEATQETSRNTSRHNIETITENAETRRGVSTISARKKRKRVRTESVVLSECVMAKEQLPK